MSDGKGEDKDRHQNSCIRSLVHDYQRLEPPEYCFPHDAGQLPADSRAGGGVSVSESCAEESNSEYGRCKKPRPRAQRYLEWVDVCCVQVAGENEADQETCRTSPFFSCSL